MLVPIIASQDLFIGTIISTHILDGLIPLKCRPPPFIMVVELLKKCGISNTVDCTKDDVL